MIVIADTSPICYLVIIGEVELLPRLFNKIFIPEAVYSELGATGAPPTVQSWIANLPDWLEVCPAPLIDDPLLAHLHLGEKQAILLAEELKADLIIVDEKAGRKAAQQKGLNVTGLIGILDLAANENLIDLPSAIVAKSISLVRMSKNFMRPVDRSGNGAITFNISCCPAAAPAA